MCDILLKSNVFGNFVGICGESSTFMFGRYEQIQLQWEIAKGVKVASTELLCLQYLVFHKVWVLAMHGFSLLDCPKPIDH